MVAGVLHSRWGCLGGLWACTLACGLACAAQAQGPPWYPYPVDSVRPPQAAGKASYAVDYVPLASASRPWRICLAMPQLKDGYWLGVAYGVVDEAKRQGLELTLMDAGGYTHLQEQKLQIETCVAQGGRALLIGAISGDGLNDLIKTWVARKLVVIDLANGIHSRHVTARSLVSHYGMGQALGQYLALRHPSGSPRVKVAWLPGPRAAAWVEAQSKGFYEATLGSSLRLLPPRYGDTDPATQTQLLIQARKADPDLRYIVGNGVAAEAAARLGRQAGRGPSAPQVLATYLTPGVLEGIQAERILAAAADSMVMQGRVAVDQAVRALEGRDLLLHVSPRIVLLDRQHLARLRPREMLPPQGYRPGAPAD